MAEKKKVGILYIATGRYIVFWKDFYKSCEKYLLTQHEKTYFVFTDNEIFDYYDHPNVKKIYQEKLAWPYSTLMRFEMFLNIENKLKEFDYIYFFNANMLVVDYVGEEILPNPEQELMVCWHPGFYNRNRKLYTYEQNPKSLAYIPEHEGQYYFMGGLNGGMAPAFLKLCYQLDTAIKKDLQNNIIAIWHDESHLNKYMLDKKPLMLTPDYGYHEDDNYKNISPFKNKIKVLIRNKNQPKYGGHDWLRGLTNKKISILTWQKQKIKKYIRKCLFLIKH